MFEDEWVSDYGALTYSLNFDLRVKNHYLERETIYEQNEFDIKS